MKRFVALAGSTFMFTFLLSAIGPVSRASAAYPCNPQIITHYFYRVGNTLKGDAWAGVPCWAASTQVKTCLQRRYQVTVFQGSVGEIYSFWGGDYGCQTQTCTGNGCMATASWGGATHGVTYRLHVNVWQFAPNGTVQGHNYFNTASYFYK